MRRLLTALSTIAACALVAAPLAAQGSARHDPYETVLSRAAANRSTQPASRMPTIVAERRDGHTVAGSLLGALAGGVGFAIYINDRCQRDRSDAGCAGSVTLAAIEGAVVGAFIGAIVGQRM